MAFMNRNMCVCNGVVVFTCVSFSVCPIRKNKNQRNTSMTRTRSRTRRRQRKHGGRAPSLTESTPPLRWGTHCVCRERPLKQPRADRRRERERASEAGFTRKLAWPCVREGAPPPQKRKQAKPTKPYLKRRVRVPASPVVLKLRFEG